MELVIEKFPRCIWHKDCPENSFNSGIVQELGEHGDRTKIKCLRCGEEGYILHCTPFGVRFCAEAP